MYGTHATNKTILYLQNNTYLQYEILTLLTILYSTYNTKLAILTYNEILTVLTVLYSTLYIYTEKKQNKKKSYLHYLHYGLHTLQKPENKGAGKYGKF